MSSSQYSGLEVLNTVSSVISAYFTVVGVSIAVFLQWRKLRERAQSVGERYEREAQVP